MSAALLGLAILASARIGLFVGSNAAPDGREPLQHAEEDARRLRQVFVELGEIAPENALLLTGASADQILAAIERVARTPAAVMVFYYSGHADDRALLLGETELSLVELARALDQASAPLDLRLIDACRSGALTRAKGAQLGERISIGATTASEGRAIITSSAEWEDSQESDRLGGSFFTLHLATALRGAADDSGDGQVTLEEAYRYVYGRTVESTLATSAGPQHPTYSYALSGRGEVVLTWTQRTGGALLLRAGHYLVLDGASGAIVAEIEPRGPATIALAAGHYRVHKRTRDAVWTGDVRIEAGATHDADLALDARVAHAQLVRKGGPRDPSAAHGLRIAGGVRGAIDDGVPAAPILRLGYELALPWLSIEPYASVTTGADLRTPRLAFTTWEVAAGLGASRAIDLDWGTLRGGLLVELVRLAQHESSDRVPARAAWAAAVGASAAYETPPILDVALTVAGEAAFYAYRSTAERELPTGEGELVTQPTYRLLFGARYAL